jgi:hypothetical protein
MARIEDCTKIFEIFLPLRKYGLENEKRRKKDKDKEKPKVNTIFLDKFFNHLFVPYFQKIILDKYSNKNISLLRNIICNEIYRT